MPHTIPESDPKGFGAAPCLFTRAIAHVSLVALMACLAVGSLPARLAHAQDCSNEFNPLTTYPGMVYGSSKWNLENPPTNEGTFNITMSNLDLLPEVQELRETFNWTGRIPIAGTVQYRYEGSDGTVNAMNCLPGPAIVGYYYAGVYALLAAATATVNPGASFVYTIIAQLIWGFAGVTSALATEVLFALPSGSFHDIEAHCTGSVFIAKPGQPTFFTANARMAFQMREKNAPQCGGGADSSGNTASRGEVRFFVTDQNGQLLRDAQGNRVRFEREFHPQFGGQGSFTEFIATDTPPMGDPYGSGTHSLDICEYDEDSIYLDCGIPPAQQ